MLTNSTDSTRSSLLAPGMLVAYALAVVIALAMLGTYLANRGDAQRERERDALACTFEFRSSDADC